MTHLRVLLSRLLSLFRTRQLDRDLEDEIASHLAEAAEEYIDQGMSAEDAHIAARRRFGGVTQTQDVYRHVRSFAWLDDIWRDVRYGLRTLRKAPAFATTAVLTLALGIGANTALFTIVDQLLLRLLPVDAPGELVSVTSAGSYYGDTWGNGNELSYPMYEALRDENQVFAGMFARFTAEIQARTLTRADRVLTEFVTGSCFPVLGVKAALGRTILPSDDDPSAPDVAVLSDRYWRAALGGDPDVIGTVIVANNRPLTIVGVAQKGFDGTSLGIASQVFVPIRLTSVLTDLGAARGRRVLDDPRIRWLTTFGRLRPRTTTDRAEAQLQPVYAARLASEVEEDGFARASDVQRARYLASALSVRPAGDGLSPLRRQLARPLWLLTAIVGTVLLVTCANLASLLLARAAPRQREFALRLALGADRRRLVRQLLVESVLLAAAGGMLGLLIATWGADALLSYIPKTEGTLTVSTTPDGRVLVFTTVIAVLTGLAFGLVPSLWSTRPDVAPALKNEGGAIVSGGFSRLRHGFILAQVALSMLLLAGAGLFVRSLSNLAHTGLGFDTTHTLSFRVDPDTHGYTNEQGKAFVSELRERLSNAPGVSNAAFASQQLLAGSAWSNLITIDGQPYDPDRRWESYNNAVSPGFFATLGIPMLQGRDFDARDQRISPEGHDAFVPRVAIANRTFVDRYLAGGYAVGAHVGFGHDPDTPTPIEIVGVAADAKYTRVRDEIQPQLFFPLLEGPRVGVVTMYVRAAEDAASAVSTVEQVARRLDPEVPIYDVRTLEEQVARSLSTDRLITTLTTLFGGLATLLAAIGLYGTLAYAVSKRTRDLGIRIALGARQHGLAWMVLREVLALVWLGTVLALPAIWAVTRFAKSQLYGVTPMDPTAIASAAALLSATAMIAGFLPARRAARVDPVIALRAE